MMPSVRRRTLALVTGGVHWAADDSMQKEEQQHTQHYDSDSVRTGTAVLRHSDPAVRGAVLGGDRYHGRYGR